MNQKEKENPKTPVVKDDNKEKKHKPQYKSNALRQKQNTNNVKKPNTNNKSNNNTNAKNAVTKNNTTSNNTTKTLKNTNNLQKPKRSEDAPKKRYNNKNDAQNIKQGANQNKRKPFHTRKNQNAQKLHFYPLGGLGEVGKNINVFECNGDMIIVDCGLVFPESDMYGIDLVIPDFSFVIQNKDKIKGIVITHGHEDHIGSLPYLLKQVNLPIYASRLTLGLLKNKLDEHGLTRSTKCIEIQPRKKFKLGCFTLDPIHVNHSIPDALGFAIACPAGVLLHTGDFKIDYTPSSGGPTDIAAIGDYGKDGVLALLSDSTNSERPGFTMTEQKVNEAFATLFDKAGARRIMIATFASNLYRIQQIIDMAVKKGRKVAVSGRSMINNTKMALELGYLRAPETALIEVEKISKYPPEQIVLITTGSQGEPLSALARMSSSSHRSVSVSENDFIIISATPIPGNEKMVTKVINGLLKLGAEVIYESMYDVHVSGHACQEEQKLILALAQPQFFLPVHGEYKQLKRHAKTAIDIGIPKENVYIGENGDHIILSKNGIEFGDNVTAGAVMVDGLGVGDVGSIVLRDRRHLSEDGLVVVVVAIDKANGEIVSGPEIVSRGFVYVKENETLIDDTCAHINAILDRLDSMDLRDLNGVRTRIRESVSGFLYRRTKRSPMILPVLIEM